MILSKIKFILFPLIIFIVHVSAYGGIDLELNNNMQIETTGASKVELSGNLIENGSGHLKGIFSSGDRDTITNFSGLTFSSPLKGNITCLIGTQYSGTGTNFTRYYEIENKSTSSDLKTNVTIITTTDEAGSLTGPFFIYTKNGNSWKGYGFGSTGNTIGADTITFPKNSQTDLIISEGVGVKVKIFLEGPYNKKDHNMNTTINGDIPLTSPYSEDFRTASNKPSTAVDWVLVQLRDAANPSTIIASRSAYLNSDGNLIDDNAASGRGIGIAAPPGDYYVAIMDRNHLAAMTASIQNDLTWGSASTVSTYNFTSASSQFYGGSAGAKEVESGVWGIIAGDVNQSSFINSGDYVTTQTEIGSSGYVNGDCDFNGLVDSEDYVKIKQNVGKSSAVPLP